MTFTTSISPPRYLIAPHWGPLLLGDETSTSRWSLDLSTRDLVEAQKRPNDESAPWVPLTSHERECLLGSIRRNEVEADPASFNIQSSETLPDWSASMKAPASTLRPSGDLLQHFLRRQRSGCGPSA